MSASTAEAALAQMADPEQYKAVYARTEGTHPCLVPDCRISQEEHHRLMFGVLAENATLKRRVAELERGA